MNKNTLILGVVVILVALGIFVYSNKMKATDSTVPVTTEGQPTEAMKPPGEQVAVSIKGFAFNPAELKIKVGQTVTWTNEDNAPHNVISNDGSFESVTLNKGESFSFTFTTAGSFDYICSIHPNMKAKVIVEQ